MPTRFSAETADVHASGRRLSEHPPADVNRGGRIWIAWETQRRSITLARHVGAELHIMDWERRGALRYPLSLLATLKLLFRHRRGVVFVQNPSMVLAAFACLLRNWLGYTLIVDRHSNFWFGGGRFGWISRPILSVMSRYSLRRADLTLVTNQELAKSHVDGLGRAFVLPDPFPDVGPRSAARMPDVRAPFSILFVSSWQTDEPIRETVEACRILGDAVRIYISGRAKPEYASMLDSKPANFIPTGFLSDEEYFDLMNSVDAVMAVSTRPATLCCGAYEGVALGKPLILGDSSATKDYFSAGCLYTSATRDDIVEKIRYLIVNRGILARDISHLFVAKSDAWNRSLAALNRAIAALTQE